MICLGIEGTAHSIGVGIVNENNEKCEVLSNPIKIYRPEKGGIHPREAANHHAENIADLITESVEKAQVDFSDVDLISFSKGPGLGPCLRTAATAARALWRRVPERGAAAAASRRALAVPKVCGPGAHAARRHYGGSLRLLAQGGPARLWRIPGIRRPSARRGSYGRRRTGLGLATARVLGL